MTVLLESNQNVIQPSTEVVLSILKDTEQLRELSLQSCFVSMSMADLLGFYPKYQDIEKFSQECQRLQVRPFSEGTLSFDPDNETFVPYLGDGRIKWEIPGSRMRDEVRLIPTSDLGTPVRLQTINYVFPYSRPQHESDAVDALTVFDRPEGELDRRLAQGYVPNGFILNFRNGTRPLRSNMIESSLMSDEHDLIFDEGILRVSNYILSNANKHERFAKISEWWKSLAKHNADSPEQ